MESTSIPTSSPSVRASANALPKGWSDNAVFVANLLGMFFDNDTQSQLLAKEIGEVDSYGGRLLPIIDLLYRGGGENLLALEREPSAHLSEFFSEVAGLTLPKTVVFPHREYLAYKRDGIVSAALETISNHPATRIDGYVTDTTLTSIAEQAGKRIFSSIAGSRDGNNKRTLFKHIAHCGLPVPATEIAASSSEIPPCLATLARSGYRAAVIKAALGASGIGLVKVPEIDATRTSSVDIPEHFFHDGPCLVQGWLEVGRDGITNIHSPSAQLFLGDHSLHIYDITEQILTDDSTHQGNESPPNYLSDHPDYAPELVRQAEVAGRWLHDQGYRGTASVDFLLTETDEGFTVYVCEINARVTGATYPSFLAKHFLPDGAWLLRNLRFKTPVTDAQLLQLLKKSNDLFIPGESEHGVFPVNFNFDKAGLVSKGQFLCLAPSNKQSRHLLRMAKIDLPCQPDRD